MKEDVYQWRRSFHIPTLIVLQIVFIILFATFVVYDPVSAGGKTKTAAQDAKDATAVYPMFQDVHVMIFIGFGFLMTFLKKYGLSAVSLNMLCAVVCLQWATLVIGFFHLHYEQEYELPNGTTVTQPYPSGVIYLNLVDSMLLSDFAAAAVLISFGVVIGKTSPLQLIVMALIEIVVFTANEVIGRKYLGAIDAGDTIFVHLFGAYFGLTASRVMYTKKYTNQEKQSSARTSDMFSMVGTIFLWMFWPSFNAAAAAPGAPQHRAILNTYLSLSACVLASFAFSAATNKNNKFVMEHIQNATLAGGVAIGASADLIVQPYGALIIGGLTGIISTLGYHWLSPIVEKKLKIHDTCGVNNLHGLPAIFGVILSCIMASLACYDQYGNGLYDVYPALKEHEDHGETVAAISNQQQALNQLAASAVTLAIAIVGGGITGLIMRSVGRWQHLESAYHKGMTVMKLALSVGKITSGAADISAEMPIEAYFDDNLFFEVNESDDEDDDEAPAPTIVTKEKTVVLKDKEGHYHTYRRRSSVSMSSNDFSYLQNAAAAAGGMNTNNTSVTTLNMA